MKLRKIILTQQIRFLNTSAGPTGPASIVDISRGLQDRYKFFQIPRVVEEYDLKKGVTFLEGNFDKRFSIDKLQIYENGVLVDAKVDSTACDQFITDCVKWIQTTFGLLVEEQSNIARGNLSNIEVEFTPRARTPSPLDKFGQRIAQVLTGYGTIAPPFQVSGFKLHCDVTTMALPKPTNFLFERREGQPYELNIYFSSAPLRTDDHLKLLDELENLHA